MINTNTMHSTKQVVNGGVAALATYALLPKSLSIDTSYAIAFGAFSLVSCIHDQELARSSLIGFIAGYTASYLQEPNGSYLVGPGVCATTAITAYALPKIEEAIERSSSRYTPSSQRVQTSGPIFAVPFTNHAVGTRR